MRGAPKVNCKNEKKRRKEKKETKYMDIYIYIYIYIYMRGAPKLLSCIKEIYI